MSNQQVLKSNGHGGPRPNSGGKRPGAGRPKKIVTFNDVVATVAKDVPMPPPPPTEPPPPPDDLTNIGDPIKFLTAVMTAPLLPLHIRMDAAKAMLPYTHKKLGEGGKKEQKQAAAEHTASKFAPSAPPKLKAVG